MEIKRDFCPDRDHMTGYSLPVLLQSLVCECVLEVCNKINSRLIAICNATIQLIVVERQNRLIAYCCCNVVPLALWLK